MRTCVRMMGVGPHRPIRELEAALDRGELDIAEGIARDCQREHAQPIRLDLALRLLPLAAGEPSYDAWACRWLSRWLTEASNPSIGQAADIAGMLADLPLEPQMMEGLLGMLRAPLAPYSTRCAAAYWGTPTTRSTETPASAGLLSP